MPEFTFDYQALLELIKDPATGLQVLASLTGFNAVLGVILAHREGELDRNYMTKFLRSRVLQQLVPIGIAGLLAAYAGMPWFLVIYLTGAAFMLYDLTGDIKDKALELWKTKQG